MRRIYPRRRARDEPREDERGIPLPPARGLFCCMRTGPPCEWCPSHPDNKEGP
jgi:hypothetical protein